MCCVFMAAPEDCLLAWSEQSRQDDHSLLQPKHDDKDTV